MLRPHPVIRFVARKLDRADHREPQRRYHDDENPNRARCSHRFEEVQQSPMPPENVSRETTGEPSPDQLEQGNDKQRFADGHEKRRDDVARPMCTKINARITDRCRDNEIKPAPAPKKQRAHHRDDGVVRRVPGWKRGTGPIPIGLVRIPNFRRLKKREHLGMRFLQLHHPHFLHLLGPAAIDRRLQWRNEKVVGYGKRNQDGQKENASLESAED